MEAPSTSPGALNIPVLKPTTTRSNSLASTTSTNSGTSLKRRARTRTRTLTVTQRGKSAGPPEHAETNITQGGERVASCDVSSPPASRTSAEAGASFGQELVATPTRSSYQMETERQSGRQLITAQHLQEGPFQGRERSWSTVHIRELFVDNSRGRQARSEGGSVRGVKGTMRGKSLPRQALRTAVSSGSSESQLGPRTPVDQNGGPNIRLNEAERRNIRDSLMSEVSATSSSLYPQSTSTGSRPESSLLPYSLDGHDEDISSFSPRVISPPPSQSEFDVDDVSYRLRLLVNNNYFLPPAHSKPSPLSLAASNPPVVQKAPTATFLDFFRLGKSKSRPTTPPAIDVQPLPVLRTTSDSTTASGHAPRPPLPHPPYPSSHQNPASRVVVLREKMDDLVTAAKQAEQDIKNRGDGRRARSRASREDAHFDDIVDPTDAVDLPLPSDGYPFAVQASALHGLGPHDSVGAALLAECLPPNSPGMWSMTTEEDIWRKALLQEAVSLSLTDTPDSSFSMPSPLPVSDSPSASFRDEAQRRSNETHASSSTPKRKIGQRIMEPLHIETEIQEVELSVSASPSKPPASALLTPAITNDGLQTPWRSSMIPIRAETPSSTQPLAPPPRKQLGNPQYSYSQTDLSGFGSKDGDGSLTTDSSRVLRKTVSSPRLSAATEMMTFRGAMTLTPPPTAARKASGSSSAALLLDSDAMPSLSSRNTRSMLRESHYSDDDLSYATPAEFDEGAAPRPSMSLSLPSGRPSLSEYSHPSPTASAFQDAVFGSCRSPSPLLRRSHVDLLRTLSPSPTEASAPPGTDVVSPPPRVSSAPRSAAVVSPPPRVSSSLSHAILRPPPRSPAVKPVYRPSTSSGVSLASGRTSMASRPTTAQTPSLPLTPERSGSGSDSGVVSPEPTPPLPAPERRRQHHASLSLDIPSPVVIPSTIHSAPAPASPTAFFDSLQSQPNAMDDLDTSDESDDDEPGARGADVNTVVETAKVYVEPRTQAISNRASSSSSRPSIMRLGNYSSPHLTPSESSSFSRLDSEARKPVGNVPPRGTFFSSRKKGGKTSLPFPPLPSSTHVLGSGTGSRPASAESGKGKSRAGTVAGPSGRRRPATASAVAEEKVRQWQRESLQRFDGMLMQHMAAERDTIKRITTNISGSRS